MVWIQSSVQQARVNAGCNLKLIFEAEGAECGTRQSLTMQKRCKYACELRTGVKDGRLFLVLSFSARLKRFLLKPEHSAFRFQWRVKLRGSLTSALSGLWSVLFSVGRRPLCDPLIGLARYRTSETMATNAARERHGAIWMTRGQKPPPVSERRRHGDRAHRVASIFSSAFGGQIAGVTGVSFGIKGESGAAEPRPNGKPASFLTPISPLPATL